MQMVGSSAQTKADCSELPMAVQMVGSSAQTKADRLARRMVRYLGFQMEI